MKVIQSRTMLKRKPRRSKGKGGEEEARKMGTTSQPLIIKDGKEDFVSDLLPNVRWSSTRPNCPT